MPLHPEDESAPEDPSFLEEHPTGIGTAIASLAVVLFNHWSSNDFSGEEAAIVVGGIAAGLSLLSPRFRRS